MNIASYYAISSEPYYFSSSAQQSASTSTSPFFQNNLRLKKLDDMRDSRTMKTVIETDQFVKLASKIWTEEERLDFIEYISENPTSGNLIKRSGGMRKIRWRTGANGKSGGVRVITWRQDENSIILVYIYRKSELNTISGENVRRLKL